MISSFFAPWTSLDWSLLAFFVRISYLSSPLTAEVYCRMKLPTLWRKALPYEVIFLSQATDTVKIYMYVDDVSNLIPRILQPYFRSVLSRNIRYVFTDGCFGSMMQSPKDRSLSVLPIYIDQLSSCALHYRRRCDTELAPNLPGRYESMTCDSYHCPGVAVWYESQHSDSDSRRNRKRTVGLNTHA